MSRAASKFDFSKQPELLYTAFRLYVTKTKFLMRFHSVMRPEDWDEPEAKWVIVNVGKHFAKYNIAPGLDVLQAMLDADDTLRDNIRGLLEHFFDQLMEVHISKAMRKFVEDNFFEHIQYRAYRTAAKKAHALIETGDFDEAVLAVQSASLTDPEGDDDWLILPDNFDDFYTFFDRAVLDSVTLPTGLAELDDRIGNGLREKELGIVAASTGAGKSMALTHFGSCAARSGWNVIHFSFENSREETLARYMTNLLDTDKSKLLEGREASDFDDLLEQYEEAAIAGPFGRIFIRRLLGTETTPMELSRQIQRIKDEKLNNDDGGDDKPQRVVVIVDYGDLMIPTHKSVDRWENQEQVFRELKDLAERHSVPVWTATQGNREGAKAKSMETHHFAGAYAKAFVADMVLTLSRPKSARGGRNVNDMGDQEGENFQTAEREIRIAKLRRDGEDNWVISVIGEFSKARFKVLSAEEVSEEEDEETAAVYRQKQAEKKSKKKAAA